MSRTGQSAATRDMVAVSRAASSRTASTGGGRRQRLTSKSSKRRFVVQKPDRCAECGGAFGIAKYPRGGRKFCSRQCRDAEPTDAPELSPVSEAELADLQGMFPDLQPAPFPWPKRQNAESVADGIAGLIEAGRWW